MLAALMVGVLIPLAAQAQEVLPGEAADRPDILVVGTDDNNEEVLYRAMDDVTRELGEGGTTFKNFTYSQSLCCPNRASTLRGQYPHNTGVLGNGPPDGGWETFFRRGLHEDTWGRTLDEAGYNTAYVGKLMNGYPMRKESDGGGSWFSVVPDGFDRWFVGSPSTTTDECFSLNGERKCRESWDDRPFDALVTERALSVVEGWDETPGPDVLFVSYWGPHVPHEYTKGYADMFSRATPSSPAFAEADVSDKPPSVRDNPNGEDPRRRWVAEYRDRLRAAAYTDDLAARVLAAAGDDSVRAYWNDNGYKTGEHRMVKKNTPYLEDARMPFLIAGPGVEAGRVRGDLVNSVDLRPTLEDIAGASTPGYVDGESFWPLARGEAPAWREYTYSEAVGSWRAVYTERGAYHVWDSKDGYEEFYDLARDPDQMDGTIDAAEEPQLGAYREAMDEFQECAGQSCRDAGKAIEEVTP